MTQQLQASAAFAALGRGLSLSLSDGALKRRVGLALVVNTLVFVALLWGVFWGAGELLAWGDSLVEVADPPWYMSALKAAFSAFRWLVYAALAIGALVYTPVLMALIGSLVLPLLHGPIFSRGRACAGAGEVHGEGTPLVQSIRQDVTRLLRFLVFSVMLLSLHLIPVIGSVCYVVAQFYLAAKTLGWDLLAHHFELHGMALPEQEQWVREHRGLVLLFGAGAALLAMIPVLQILFVTTNVASAGVLSAWLDGAPRRP